MKGERVLVLSAGSGIGRALVRELAAEGTRLVLAGRHREDLERIAADCRIRYGVEASVDVFDALATQDHAALLERFDRIDEASPCGVLFCTGEMVDEASARGDIDLARHMIDVNYTAAVSVLECAARQLERRGRGWICAIGSVAGDRGRPGNYLYGSSKSALATYLQGLRSRLARRGVPVVTIKPGFIDTAMTYGRKSLPLVASPERVARDALRGIRRDRAVVYTPWFWRWIMWAIRLVPDRIYKRLDF